MNNSYFKHPSPITQHPSPNTHHPTPNTQHPSPITHHPTPITHHPTPITQHILLLALALLFPLHVDASHVINIDSQERFDQMNTLLTRAIDDGETDIVVDIAQGVYFYRNNHLDRDGDQCPNVSIAIQGHDAVLIAAGRDYHDGDSLKDNVNPDAVFIDMAQLTALDFWDDCRFAEGLVEVVDEEAKLCRLPVSTLNTQHPTPNTQIPTPNNTVFLRIDGELRQIQLSRLLYVSGMKDYVMFCMEDEKRPLVTHLTMKAVEEMLPTDQFMRVNRSYIVALDKIRSIDRNDCIYIGSEVIRVTEAYRESFLEYVNSKFPGA